MDNGNNHQLDKLREVTVITDIKRDYVCYEIGKDSYRNLLAFELENNHNGHDLIKFLCTKVGSKYHPVYRLRNYPDIITFLLDGRADRQINIRKDTEGDVVRQFIHHFYGLRLSKRLPVGMAQKIADGLEEFADKHTISTGVFHHIIKKRNDLLTKAANPYLVKRLYHPNMKQCFSHLIKHFQVKHRTLNPCGIVELTQRLNFDQLFLASNWEDRLLAAVKRYSLTYDCSLAGNSIVFAPEQFYWTLLTTVDDADLNWKKQKIHLSELQYFLFRLTRHMERNRRLYGLAELPIARNYFLSWGGKKQTSTENAGSKGQETGRESCSRASEDDYKRTTGRRINENKIGYILKLLNKYEFINVRKQFNRPNIFSIGRANPFFREEVLD